VKIGQPRLRRQPLGQDFEVQQLARLARVLPLLVGDDHQRMHVSARAAPVLGKLIGYFLGYQLVGDQVGQHLRQLEAAVGGALSGGCSSHGVIILVAGTISDTCNYFNGLGCIYQVTSKFCVDCGRL
jgi:hypothetical protein